MRSFGTPSTKSHVTQARRVGNYVERRPTEHRVKRRTQPRVG